MRLMADFRMQLYFLNSTLNFTLSLYTIITISSNSPIVSRNHPCFSDASKICVKNESMSTALSRSLGLKCSNNCLPKTLIHMCIFHVSWNVQNSYMNIENITGPAHLICYVGQIWDVSAFTIYDEFVVVYA